MNYRQLVKLISDDQTAPTGWWLAALWVKLVAVAWLGAALAFSSPGVARLVAAAPCESDATQESERATVAEACAASHFRRPILRQWIVRPTFSFEFALQSQSSTGVRAPQRPDAPLMPPDAQLGAGRPLRC